MRSQNLYRKSISLLAAVLFLSIGALLSSPSQAGHYDDWYECADNCSASDADCVDACTDDFNSNSGGDPVAVSFPMLKLRVKGPIDDKPTHRPSNRRWAQRCPLGSSLSPFDMPIYGEDGFFVVGFKTVWMCLPEDVVPAG
jgi:hypothetical protein